MNPFGDSDDDGGEEGGRGHDAGAGGEICDEAHRDEEVNKIVGGNCSTYRVPSGEKVEEEEEDKEEEGSSKVHTKEVDSSDLQKVRPSNAGNPFGDDDDDSD